MIEPDSTGYHPQCQLTLTKLVENDLFQHSSRLLTSNKLWARALQVPTKAIGHPPPKLGDLILCMD